MSCAAPKEEVIVSIQGIQPYDLAEQPLRVDKCLQIRTFYLTMLCVTAAVTVAILAVGSCYVRAGAMLRPTWLDQPEADIGINQYIWSDDRYISAHSAFQVSHPGIYLIPLVLQYCFTALLDCISGLHSMTLRWSLAEEDRLVFNSNPRLFACSRRHGPNSWYINVISALASVIAYGSIASLATTVQARYFPDDYNAARSHSVGSTTYGVDISGWAMLILGLAMAVQLGISTWSYACSGKLVRTWSSNVLMTRLALDLSRREDTHYVSNTSFKTPRNAIRSLRYLTMAIWILFSLSTICTIITVVLAHQRGSLSKEYVQTWILGEPDGQAFWDFFGQIYFLFAYPFSIANKREWLGIILQSCFQAPVTLGLHYSELLFGVWRDERTGRRALRNGERQAYQGLFRERLFDWPALSFFLFKGVFQWVFQYAISVSLVVVVNLLPLLVVTTMLLILALGNESLSRWSPKGSQPATFGELRLLDNLLRGRSCGTFDEECNPEVKMEVGRTSYFASPEVMGTTRFRSSLNTA